MTIEISFKAIMDFLAIFQSFLQGGKPLRLSKKTYGIYSQENLLPQTSKMSFPIQKNMLVQQTNM